MTKTQNTPSSVLIPIQTLTRSTKPSLPCSALHVTDDHEYKPCLPLSLSFCKDSSMDKEHGCTVDVYTLSYLVVVLPLRIHESPRSNSILGSSSRFNSWTELKMCEKMMVYCTVLYIPYETRLIQPSLYSSPAVLPEHTYAHTGWMNVVALLLQ